MNSIYKNWSMRERETNAVVVIIVNPFVLLPRNNYSIACDNN